MSDEYIRKQDVLNLPQSIERNLCGEIVERSIDVKAIESLEPADVVQVVRCRDCIYMGEPECLMAYDGKEWTDEDGFCHIGDRRGE